MQKKGDIFTFYEGTYNEKDNSDNGGELTKLSSRTNSKLPGNYE